MFKVVLRALDSEEFEKDEDRSGFGAPTTFKIKIRKIKTKWKNIFFFFFLLFIGNIKINSQSYFIDSLPTQISIKIFLSPLDLHHQVVKYSLLYWDS